jgi:hypothetical protein
MHAPSGRTRRLASAAKAVSGTHTATPAARINALLMAILREEWEAADQDQKRSSASGSQS